MSTDNHFGPRLPGVFDFTILFEQSILSLLPTALFICLTPLRISRLVHREKRVQAGLQLWSKLIVASTLLCIQIAQLALWSLPSTPRTKTSIAEGVVGLLEAIAILSLSYFEHVKSLKPSALLNGYLFFSVILDLAPARSYFIRGDLAAIAGVFVTSLAIKTVLLVLEEIPKKFILGEKDLPQESQAGVISRSVFWWLNTLFFKGARSLLTIDSLGIIEEKFSSRHLLRTLEDAWEKNPKTGKFALMNCTMITFKWQLFAGVLPRLLNIGFTFAQPFLINNIIDFISEPPESETTQTAGGLIGATVLIYVGLAVSTAWYKHMTFQLMTMYRGCLASIVFKKTLRLRSNNIKDAAPVTLMSTDVEQITRAGQQIHDIWASFIELPIAIYLLYRHVGVPSVFILIPALVTTISGGIITPGMGPAVARWNQAVQERIGSTSTMLNSVKSIKMLGLTDFFHKRIQYYRTEELKRSRKFRLIMLQLNATAMFSEVFTPVIVILAAILWTKRDEGLSVAQAFTSLSIISIASGPLIRILVSMIQFFGAIGCFTRLQEFLASEERMESRNLQSAQTKSTDSSENNLDAASKRVRPHGGSRDIELASIDDQIAHYEIFNDSGLAVTVDDGLIVVGEDSEILKDVNVTFKKGTVSMVVGRVGCGKSSLLKAIVGEISLKTGQINVNVPSMAYCDQSPWLQNISIRDNIAGQSAVDEEWLAKVIKACALDEDIELFPTGDLTLVGTGGVALSGGQKQRVALARAVYAHRSLIVLDDVFSGLDNKTSRLIFQNLLGSSGLLRHSRTTVILATNNVNFLPAADFITMLEDGKVSRNQVTYKSMDAAAWGLLEENSRKTDDSPEVEDGNVTDETDVDKDPTSFIPKTTEADLTRQTGDTECYKIYLRSMGATVLVFFIVASVVSTVLGKMPQIWLQIWTERGTGPKDYGFLAGYVAFPTASIAATSANLAFFIMIGIPRSATRLHNMLLNAVIRAPLYFFTTTDSGVTLNRFSQDMTLIDQDLPMAFAATFLLVLEAITQIGIIASGASYVGATIPACILAIYCVQKYYLRTSRQMRFLDLENKSPLYTHFSETLTGLSTIRAYGWSEDFLHDNHRRLDKSQKPFYMMFCIQRWLQVVLDLFVAGMGLVLVAIAVNLRGSTSKGAIGLAMVNLIGFNATLTMTIDQWTELETCLGAISRLKWFRNNTPDENLEHEKEIPPSEWPLTGAIELDDVCASYSDETKPVLHNVSLKIDAGTRVGVCGRSGSGKSSLVLTILRLLEVRSGSIKIDSEDILTMPRQQIRSRLTALPQDPLKFSGTIRYNLDPEDNVQSDAILTESLKKTSIWSVVEARGGLDADMEEAGFSAGQLQLFCMARALLSRSSVVVLDEATSSVDRQTDEEMRRVINQELVGRTVIEVAHRLEVVKECDMAVVMGEGRVLEAGPPEELLRTEGSAFKALWESQHL